MNNSLQTIRLEIQNPFSMKEQFKFWKRTHRLLLNQREGGWRQVRNAVWVDYIYHPGESVKVYLTLEENAYKSFRSLLYPKGKRRRKSDVIIHEVSGSELELPPKVSICELKLAYENLFALGGDPPVQLPSQMTLVPGECARISFCFIPIQGEEWDIAILKKKMEGGQKELRQVVSQTGWVRYILYFINAMLQRFLFSDKKGAVDQPWLSGETLQKLNDSYFKSYIRLAAPQHILPKLARPFQSREGENRLVIHFLPRKEQKASLQEINKLRIGLYSRSDLNPNILGCKEISQLLPLLNIKLQSTSSEARPKLG